MGLIFPLTVMPCSERTRFVRGCTGKRTGVSRLPNPSEPFDVVGVLRTMKCQQVVLLALETELVKANVSILLGKLRVLLQGVEKNVPYYGNAASRPVTMQTNALAMQGLSALLGSD